MLLPARIFLIKNGGAEWQNDFGNLPNYYQTFYRNYDPTIGRFIGIDPEADGANSTTPYQYADNNPISFNDPLGNASRPTTIASDDGGDTNVQTGTDTPPATGNDGAPGQDGPGSNGNQGGFYLVPGQSATKATEEKPKQHYKYIINSTGQLVNEKGEVISSPIPIDGLNDVYYEAGSIPLDDGTRILTSISPTTAYALTTGKYGYIDNSDNTHWAADFTDKVFLKTSTNIQKFANQGGDEWFDLGNKTNSVYGAAVTATDIARIGNVLKVGEKTISGLGVAGGIGGTALDGVGVYNYYHPKANNVNSRVSPTKFAADGTVTLYGIYGGIPSAVGAAIYFGIDAFYPGGVKAYIINYGKITKNMPDLQGGW